MISHRVQQQPQKDCQVCDCFCQAHQIIESLFFFLERCWTWVTWEEAQCSWRTPVVRIDPCPNHSTWQASGSELQRIGVPGTGAGFRGRAGLAWSLDCREQRLNDSIQARARVGARLDEGASQNRERKPGHEAMARYLRTLEGGSENTRADGRQNTTGPWAGSDSWANQGAVCNQRTYVAMKMS